MYVRLSPVIGILLAVTAAAGADTADRWRVLYSYDDLSASLVINDFKFVTAKHGVAAGFLIDKAGKVKPTVLSSDDAGQHWALSNVKDVPISLFFRGESRGWMVTDDAIWRTDDGGRKWLKLAPLAGIERLCFVTDDHGWAAGAPKKVYETTDGGKNWTEVPAAGEPDSSAERTVYNWIDFAGPDVGMVTGWTPPPGDSRLRIPEWINPARSNPNRREVPHVSIFLQTRDGGKHWNASTGSLFGQVTRVRLSMNGFGLGLIEFKDAFDWPSEVFRIDWTTGRSERVFRQQNRLITDVALPPSGPAYLAGVEKVDRLTDSPVPAKLKILRSDDLDNWQEMDVDYRATAHRAMISAVDDRNIWVATDTGIILKLVAAK